MVHDFVSYVTFDCFVQILWEPTESSAAACARRLWKRPMGVHRGLRQHLLTTDSWRASPPSRALMQLNQGSTSLNLLPYSLPPSHPPCSPLWLFSFHTESKLYLNGKGIILNKIIVYISIVNREQAWDWDSRKTRGWFKKKKKSCLDWCCNISPSSFTFFMDVFSSFYFILTCFLCVQAVYFFFFFFHNGFNCPDHVLLNGQVHVWVSECLLNKKKKKSNWYFSICT